MSSIKKTGEFETLKILKKGRSTYVGIDVVEGELLIHRILEGEGIHKRFFYKWCSSLCNTLHAYHMARKTTFKFITPYSLVVDWEENIHLLDLDTDANQELKEYLKGPLVREHFAIPNGKRCYTNTYLADYYSFAKIIQFIISQVQLEPIFSRKENKKFKSIVQRCFSESQKDTFKSMKAIEREINKISQRYL